MSILYAAQDNYPYTKLQGKSAAALFYLSQMADLLPHGAGIDYTWYLQYYSYHGENFIKADNNYHAMDESGFYCHIYDFTAKYRHNTNIYKPCHICSGAGFRVITDLARIRQEQEQDTIEFLSLTYPNTKIYNYGDINLFTCNYCSGSRIEKIPVFELMNLRVSRQYSCCGFGLSDYLSDILYL